MCLHVSRDILGDGRHCLCVCRGAQVLRVLPGSTWTRSRLWRWFVVTRTPLCTARTSTPSAPSGTSADDALPPPTPTPLHASQYSSAHLPIMCVYAGRKSSPTPGLAPEAGAAVTETFDFTQSIHIYEISVISELNFVLFSHISNICLSEYRHWRCGLRGTVVPASVTSHCLV